MKNTNEAEAGGKKCWLLLCLFFTVKTLFASVVREGAVYACKANPPSCKARFARLFYVWWDFGAAEERASLGKGGRHWARDSDKMENLWGLSCEKCCNPCENMHNMV